MVFEKGGVKSDGEAVEDIEELQSNLRVMTGFELQQLLQLDSDALEKRLIGAGIEPSSRELLRQAIQLLKAQKKEERRQRDIQKIQTDFGGQYSPVGFSLAAVVGGCMACFGLKLLLTMRTFTESVGAFLLILTGSPLLATGVSTLLGAPLPGWIILALIAISATGIVIFKMTLITLRKLK